MAFRPGLLAGALSALSLGTAACSRPATLELQWTGADSGRATLHASGARCGTVVRLIATVGDTGVELLLYPNGQRLVPGDYPVLAAGDARDTRPAAAAAARWLDSTSVVGLRGAKGTVRITQGDPLLGGEFRLTARRDGNQAEYTLAGRFRQVPVGACPDSAG